MTIQTEKAPIYTLQFFLLCVSAFLFFASFNMLIPELPDYLSKMGGEDYKGLIIALFTVSAGLSRPFSGKLADTVGRKPVIFIGVLVCFVCAFLYPVLSGVLPFLLLRFFHGFSTGFAPTGTAALLSDIVPPERRGEAMGFLGMMMNLGTATGPVIGSELARYSMDWMFYTSGCLSLVSLLILWKMKETLTEKEPFRFQILYLKKEEIFEAKVFLPSLMIFLGMYGFGTMLTIIPDLSAHLGIKNKGIFFSVYTLSSLAIRFLAGKASDQYGRVPVMKMAGFVLAFAFVYIGMANSGFHLLLGAVALGVGVGMASPTLFAWTIDLSNDENRGRALATLYIFMEAGIGIGAFCSGWLYSNQTAAFATVFFTAAALNLLASLILFARDFGRR